MIGAVIGGLTWLWGIWGMELVQSRLLYVILLVLIPVFVTGGIHLDGLLDTADALNSYQPRERKLEILKDSNAGAFAVITALVYFLLYLGVYSEMTVKSLPVICAGFVLSRAMGAFSIAAFPMAKNTGLAATFSDGAQKTCVKITSLCYAGIVILFMLWYEPVLGICVSTGAALEYWYYYKMSKKEFGGITGDLAGFHMQISELVIAVACVVGEILLRVL